MTKFLIDTNVISESFKKQPHPAVSKWFEGQTPEALFLSTTVIAELRAGIESLQLGRRRADLDRWCEDLVEIGFAGRVLGFDQAAAFSYGRIVAVAKRAGRPAHLADAQIAAVALVHDLSVATRDVAGFAGFGVALVNPFEGA